MQITNGILKEKKSFPIFKKIQILGEIFSLFLKEGPGKRKAQ